MPSVERSAWLLGLAATLASDEASDADAAKELVVVAEGDHGALEGAYGRCLALVSVLPDDANARRALDLLRRAIRLSEAL
jgi:hypothetical protein